MEAFLNIDLLWVGLAVAGAGTLGCSIYFSDPKNATARSFLAFTAVSILWGIANFASGRFLLPTNLLWSIRIVLFFAAWHAFSFFVLARQFPNPQPVFRKRSFWLFSGWTLLVSLLTLSPFVYERVLESEPTVVTQTGPGIAFFGLTVLFYVGWGILSLGRKLLKAHGNERRQMEWVFLGMLLTFAFLITFDFVFPAFLNNPSLVPLGGLFLLPFIIAIGYAILEYRLFNPRVALFGALTFLLATAAFFDILFSSSLALILYRSVELVLILLAGIWLIRSMVREIQLSRDLEEANQRQVTLIHFITHQIKGFVAKSRNIFSMALEGDFGPVSDELRPMLQAGFDSDTQGVNTIQEILNASNIKSGKVTYKMEPFDLKALIDETVAALKPNAEKKGVALASDTGAEPLMYTGDRAQLANAFRNLIDNSIKYTPTGEVDVSLAEAAGKITFTVMDTGVGITPEDMANLFTEGGHGKESAKVNVESTGFGLYIVKNIIEAHNGRVWAESEGAGKGSKFTVLLPA